MLTKVKKLLGILADVAEVSEPFLANSAKSKESPDEEIKVLKLALDEARMKYRSLLEDYRNLGTKVFTLMATELAIITFILAANPKGGDSDKNVFARFVPNELYGIIFFALGIALIIIAIGILLWCVTRNRWAVPAERNVLSNLYLKDEKSFLSYLKDDYLSAFNYCDGRYQKRRVAFDASIVSFVLGAIILMVIKFGG